MGAHDPDMLERLDHLLTVASRYGVGARSLEVEMDTGESMAAGVEHANLLATVSGLTVAAVVHPDWYDAAREIIGLVMMIRGEFDEDPS